MKKYLFIIMILIFLTGCSNKYQVSDLTLDGSSIKGVFKNDSSDICNISYIYVELTSGTLKIDEKISLFYVEPGEIRQIDEYCKECKNLNNSNVQIKTKKIECKVL